MLKTIISAMLVCLCCNLAAQPRNAEILSYETSLAIKNGRLYKTETVRIRINTIVGEKYATVAIPYSKIYQVSGISAYILDMAGNRVRELKKSDITDRSDISDGSFFEDHFVKEFTLIHNQLPFTLCYTYQEEADEYMLLDYWAPVLAASIPTARATLNVEVPRDFRIATLSRFCTSFSSDTLASTIRYNWQASYNTPYLSENCSPPLGTLFPTVIIAPERFRYGIAGSQETWTAFGDWCAGLTGNLEDLPSMEIFKAQSLTSGIHDTIEKIKSIYHYVQDEVRYINISIKTGGMKPFPASYVAQNKYGDCKALSNYLKALLSAGGIRSFYTLVESGSPIEKIDRTFPSQQFDHVIVSVPVGKDTLFLDATSKNAFGYTGTFIQNRDAFIVTKGSSHFAHIPGLTKKEVLETRKIFLTPTVTGSVLCSVNHCFRGEKYEELVGLHHEYNSADNERALSEFLSTEGLELTKCNIKKTDRDSREVWAFYSGRFDKLFKVYGNDQIMSLPPPGLPKFEDPSLRKTPVQIDFPIARTDTIVYNIPVGSVISSLPASKKISGRFGSYSVEFHTTGNYIEALRTFELNTGYYKIDEYREFFDFIKTIKNTDNSSRIVFAKKIN